MRVTEAGTEVDRDIVGKEQTQQQPQRLHRPTDPDDFDSCHGLRDLLHLLPSFHSHKQPKASCRVSTLQLLQATWTEYNADFIAAAARVSKCRQYLSLDTLRGATRHHPPSRTPPTHPPRTMKLP